MYFNPRNRDEFIKALRKLIAFGFLSAEDQSAAEAEIERITGSEGFDVARGLKLLAEIDAKLFALQLMQRQGTKPLNFDRLYRLKDELDRRLLGSDGPENK